MIKMMLAAAALAAALAVSVGIGGATQEYRYPWLCYYTLDTGEQRAAEPQEVSLGDALKYVHLNLGGDHTVTDARCEPKGMRDALDDRYTLTGANALLEARLVNVEARLQQAPPSARSYSCAYAIRDLDRAGVWYRSYETGGQYSDAGNEVAEAGLRDRLGLHPLDFVFCRLGSTPDAVVRDWTEQWRAQCADQGWQGEWTRGYVRGARPDRGP